MTVVKIVLALGGLMSMSAIAGNYVQVNAGLSGYRVDVNSSYLDGNIKDKDTSYRVALGSDAGNFRYALDYTHYGTIDDVETVTRKDGLMGLVNVTESAGYVVESEGIGLSLMANIKTSDSKLTPYVGGRVSINRSEIGVVSTTSVLGLTDGAALVTDGKTTTVGVGAMLGLQYQITPNVALDMNTEYNHLGKIDVKDDDGDIKLNQIGVNVGVRLNF